MVVENLTQRADELVEVGENLNAIRNYLINNKILLDEKGNVTAGQLLTTSLKAK